MYRCDREAFELAEHIVIVALVRICFGQQTRACGILIQARVDRFDVTGYGTGTIDRFD